MIRKINYGYKKQDGLTIGFVTNILYHDVTGKSLLDICDSNKKNDDCEILNFMKELNSSKDKIKNTVGL